MLWEKFPDLARIFRVSQFALWQFTPLRSNSGSGFPPRSEGIVVLGMAQALDGDDVDLLIRWSGSVLPGLNIAQRFMLLEGRAGGGKGTFCRGSRGDHWRRQFGADANGASRQNASRQVAIWANFFLEARTCLEIFLRSEVRV